MQLLKLRGQIIAGTTMPKELLDAKRDTRLAAELDSSLDTSHKSGTTSRRVRNFSCEICFALALTLAAVASLFAAVQHEAAKTATAAASTDVIPPAQAPAKTQ